MDFLKLMVLKILIRYPCFNNAFPHSQTIWPFGSVTTKEVGYSLELHWRRLGLIQNLVLPEPEPPTIKTFLLRAFFGLAGRFDSIRRSVFVRIILSSNFGATNGSISLAVPQRADPYSILWRYFLAFFPFR